MTWIEYLPGCWQLEFPSGLAIEIHRVGGGWQLICDTMPTCNEFIHADTLSAAQAKALKIVRDQVNRWQLELNLMVEG